MFDDISVIQYFIPLLLLGINFPTHEKEEGKEGEAVTFATSVFSIVLIYHQCAYRSIYWV